MNPYGAEYWSARDLAPLLGYKNRERVPELIEHAKAACRNAGEEVDDPIRASSKMITIGQGGQREVEDFYLSRHGAYLFAMNGDPREPGIAAAQAYFAFQTRRMQQWDALRERIGERVERRDQLADSNTALHPRLPDHPGRRPERRETLRGRSSSNGLRGLHADVSPRRLAQTSRPDVSPCSRGEGSPRANLQKVGQASSA